MRWYAVYTSSRAEKKVKERLDAMQIQNYLPLCTEVKLWSDRKKRVSTPLIPGYIFVCVSEDDFVCVLNTRGVLAFLKEKSKIVSIPDKQIEQLRQVVDNTEEDIEFTTSPVSPGDKVILTHGKLKGIIGELIEMRGKYKLAMRIDYFGSALITVPLGWVEKVENTVTGLIV